MKPLLYLAARAKDIAKNLPKIRSKGGSVITRKDAPPVVMVGARNPHIPTIAMLAGGGAVLYLTSEEAREAGEKFLEIIERIIHFFKDFAKSPPLFLTTAGGIVGGWILGEDRKRKIIYASIGGVGGYMVGKHFFPVEEEPEEIIPSTNEELKKTPDRPEDIVRFANKKNDLIIERDKIHIERKSIPPVFMIAHLLIPWEVIIVSYSVKNNTDIERSVWGGLSIEDPEKRRWKENRFPHFLDAPPKELIIPPFQSKSIEFRVLIPEEKVLPYTRYNVYMAIWNAYDLKNNLILENLDYYTRKI